MKDIAQGHDINRSESKGPRWRTRLDLDPQSASEIPHPEAPWRFPGPVKDQGGGGGPNPGDLCPLPQIAGLVLPLISTWNYPACKNQPCHISQPHTPSAMAHTLSVESASLWTWINPLLTYHFVSHWILSVMRHQEPELHSVLKPGTTSFGWVWVPAHGFKFRSVVNGFSFTPTSLTSPLLTPTHLLYTPMLSSLIKAFPLLSRSFVTLHEKEHVYIYIFNIYIYI